MKAEMNSQIPRMMLMMRAEATLSCGMSPSPRCDAPASRRIDGGGRRSCQSPGRRARRAPGDRSPLRGAAVRLRIVRPRAVLLGAGVFPVGDAVLVVVHHGAAVVLRVVALGAVG